MPHDHAYPARAVLAAHASKSSQASDWPFADAKLCVLERNFHHPVFALSIPHSLKYRARMSRPEKPPQTSTPGHAARFDATLTKLLSVPKAEILRREDDYRKQRGLKKKESK